MQLELKDTITLCPRYEENDDNLGGCTEKRHWICYNICVVSQ